MPAGKLPLPPSAPRRRSVANTLGRGRWALNNRPVSGLASWRLRTEAGGIAFPNRSHASCDATWRFSGWPFKQNDRDAPALAYRCGGSQGFAVIPRTLFPFNPIR